MGLASFYERRPHIIPALISGAMLLGCLHKWPYGYYTFLRWVVTGTAVFIAWLAGVGRGRPFLWLFALIGLLFNPIIPIHLERETWVVIDIVVAGIMLVGVVFVRTHPSTEPEHSTR